MKPFFLHILSLTISLHFRYRRVILWYSQAIPIEESKKNSWEFSYLPQRNPEHQQQKAGSIPRIKNPKDRSSGALPDVIDHTTINATTTVKNAAEE